MENQTAQQDNSQTQTATAAPATQAPVQDSFSWKSHLGNDLANAPMFKKFDDTKEGMVNAFKSHAELEKMLGHEKVPVPKGPDDKEGWNRYNKAMGVPDLHTQYKLDDVSFPPELGNVALEKEKFAEVIHKYNLTPSQANGIWKEYSGSLLNAYSQHQQKSKEALDTTINSLRGEWGDAYDSNVELGQMVINKFAPNQDASDWLTETLAAHPFGAKFLAQVGKQFSENKIGEFKYQQFSRSPEEAMSEINKIRQDPKHPYMNEKATIQERNAAIDYVNSLYAIANKGK